MKIKDTVIHIEFKEPVNGKKHDYFGSISAIFSTYTNKDTGACLQVLYRAKIEPYKPYENKRCIIRKGSVKRKAGNRTPPVKVLRVSDI